jgi:carboxyl-terminal processing protease
VTHATRRRTRLLQRLLPCGAVLIALLFAVHASAESVRNDPLRQAQVCENNGQWLDACRLYDEMIRKERGNLEAREGYHRCLRQYQIKCRHTDRVYRDTLTRLKPAAALDIYEAVLNTVSATYVDRSKVDINALFKHGVQELRYALNQHTFVNEHLKEASPAVLEDFKNRLAAWPDRKIERSEVRNLILSLAGLAQDEGLVQNKAAFAVVLALEFAFGACTGLDEYTLFLTPQHYGAIQATLRGKFVGVGIDVAVIEQQLVITRVYPKSPAANAELPLKEGMRILRIDQQVIDKNISPERAAELLRGETDSKVDLEIFVPAIMTGGMTAQFPVTLTRKPVEIPSVDWYWLDEVRPDAAYPPDDIGYIRITHFQETSVQEVQEALAQLQTRGMKGLVLDLRGNPGGAFMPAVKIAELFLPEGVIVNTTSQFAEFKDKAFRIKGNPNALTIPLCVLIDSETASSAELLAGALKENKRASLFGQTTFGKGSIQCIFPLDKSDKATGGIRITVAKFTSPSKNPYSNVGVSPTFPSGVDERALIEAARQELRLLMGRMMGMPSDM